LSRAIDFEEDKDKVQMLKDEILSRVQKDPDKDYYTEMFIWFYLHKKEFTGAVIQAKALDKRKKQNGKRVFEVGNICLTNDAYSAAKSAFQYVVDQGESTPYYHRAVENKLNIEFIEVTEKKNYSKEELNSVATQFETTLDNLGKSQHTLGIIMQLANIYAFYMNEPQKAQALILETMDLPMTKRDRAELKILLGDVYIVSGKIWEASLLYMQVEKEFSEDVIGHEAKFKNAKVFYYDGEFEYAKAQLDVLKASTSKLIANDAMQLSLLLQDNLGVDTIMTPVRIYASADLLLQQNRHKEALMMLDSLSGGYPFHALADEVLFKRGEIFEELQQWDKALEMFGTVVDSYAHDILADDAAFRMAKIYENRLSNKEKAAEYYKKILFEFPSSLYNAESRKRFREIKATFL
jgi:tetratricopeptide (TPR) repeat protein